MNLDELRERIDALDAKLVEILNERVSLAVEIGKVKKADGEEIYVPSREKQVLESVQQMSDGPMPPEALKAVYREIMSASLSLETDMKVAYLGPPATFTHQAARNRFGVSVQYLDCSTIADVFTAVENKVADYGVVPIENSTEGAVTHTLDQCIDMSLKIYAELFLPVAHHLMAEGARDDIKQVYSHPQVFGQCRRWLQENMPNVEQVPVSSTAKAAEIASQDKTAAALAGELAAELYGLKVLEKNIQDISGNTTRFLILGKKTSSPTGQDKTSIVFSVNHQVGALYEALESFKESELNLTKIESRPSKSKAWEYFFFVDFEGHAEDEKVKAALQGMQGHCQFMTVLGSYPRTVDEAAEKV